MNNLEYTKENYSYWAGLVLFFWAIHTSFPAFLIPGGAENAAIGVIAAAFYLIYRKVLLLPIHLTFFAAFIFLIGLITARSISVEAVIQTIIFSFMPIIILKLTCFLGFNRIMLYIRIIYFLWVFLSLSALLGFGGVLEPLLKLLFSADSGLNFTINGRGGSGLTFPEQSHIAPYIVLFLYCLIFYGSSKDRLFAIIGFFPIILVNGSRTLVVLLILTLFIQIFGKTIFSFKKILQIILLSIGLVYVLISNPFIGNSIDGLLSLILDFDINRTAQIMSGRAIANYVYIHDLINYPFGHGFDLSREYFFTASDALNVNYTAIGAFDRTGRQGLPIFPRSYLVYFIYVYGFLGIVFVFAMVKYCCKNTPFTPLFVLAFVQIFVVGLPSLTAPWFALGVANVLHNQQLKIRLYKGCN